MPRLISQKNNNNEVLLLKNTTSISQVVIDSFSKNQFQSAKYQIQIKNNSSYQTTEFLVVHDGVTTYVVEYGTVNTGDILSSFTSELSGSSIQLLATPVNSTETQFKIVRKSINS